MNKDCKIQSEITHLNPEDFFMLENHKTAKFDYPVHFHMDCELNLVMDVSGKRIVGDSLEPFSEIDLVLLGSNLPHAWKAESNPKNHVINIKFQDNFHDCIILSKRIFTPIKDMLERSSRGIVFNKEVSRVAAEQMEQLSLSQGFSSAIQFLTLLYDLSTSHEQRVLASPNYSSSSMIRTSQSRRINIICTYINENYKNPITLKEIGDLVNMSESAASHFFKKRTNRNFITYLNDVRIGNASRLLEETTRSISDIADSCGFSNMSNFNQIFKKYKNQTAREYRSEIQNAILKF